MITRGNAGVDIYYDLAGQRAFTLTSFADFGFTNTRREDYAYDAGGRIDLVYIGSGYYDAVNQVAVAPSGPGTLRSNYDHDLMGRQIQQIDYLETPINGLTVAYQHTSTFNAKGQLETELTIVQRTTETSHSSSAYDYGSGSGYALGSVVSISGQTWRNADPHTFTLTLNSHDWYDGAVQAQTAFTPNTAQPGTIHVSTYQQSVFGGQAQLRSVNIRDGRPRTVAFTNTIGGQAIRRDEQDRKMTSANGDPHEVWHRFGGKELGYAGNNGSFNTTYHASIADRSAVLGIGAFRNGSVTAIASADFDESVSQITSYAQGSSSGGYTVRSGETLSSIAANLWGDASLWYRLAEVNGLSDEAALIEGQTLIVPAGVMKSTHTASTFKPYDPADVIGDTGPTTPIQPKPKKNKCGALGQVVLTVIAVAVSAWTGFTTSGFFAGILGNTGGAIATGAVAGAAGSVASQSVGVATGIQDKFSWNAVGLAALETGIGGGLKVNGVGGNGWPGAAVRGAVSSAGAQFVAAAIGPQDKFSWSSVAAAGVISGVGQGYNPKGPLAPALNFSAKLIGGAGTLSLVDGTDFGDNALAVLPSMIGSTIGGAIAGGIASGGSQEEQLADYLNRGLDRGEIGSGAYQVADLTGRPGKSRNPWNVFGDALNAIADFVGFDGGRFGYNGPKDRRFPWDGSADGGDRVVIVGSVSERARRDATHSPVMDFHAYAKAIRRAQSESQTANPGYWNRLGQATWNSTIDNSVQLRNLIAGVVGVPGAGPPQTDPISLLALDAPGLMLQPLLDGGSQALTAVIPEDTDLIVIGIREAHNAKHPFIFDPSHEWSSKEIRDAIVMTGAFAATLRFGGRRVGASAAVSLTDDLGRASIGSFLSSERGAFGSHFSRLNGGEFRSWDSFPAFKAEMGRAGDDLDWHHIVEQYPANEARFGAREIHNTENIVVIDRSAHNEISRYYSRPDTFTGGLTIRDWLSTQSFEAQRIFGERALRRFGG